MAVRLTDLSFNALTTAGLGDSAAARTLAQQTFVVNVSDTPAVANIVRGGFQVPAAKINPTEIAKVIDGFTQIAPKDLPRVVTQSITAGTKVARGTAIDLTLAPKNRIPLSVFDGVHLDLRNKTMDDIAPLVTNAVSRKTLLTFVSAADVPAPERTALEAAFKGLGVEVDDTKAGKSFSQAFDAARGALAFFE